MLEHLKLTWRFLCLSSFFWILVSSYCYGRMFISSFCSKLLVWVLAPFPSLLVPSIFFFISLCIAFTFYSILWLNSTNSVSILITVFWTLHLIGWLSLHRLVLFLEFWSVLSRGPYYFVSVHLLDCKGWTLRYSPDIQCGWSNPHCCDVVLYVREQSEKEQCCFVGSWLAFSHFLHYPTANWAFQLLIPRWVGFCMF